MRFLLGIWGGGGGLAGTRRPLRLLQAELPSRTHSGASLGDDASPCSERYDLKRIRVWVFISQRWGAGGLLLGHRFTFFALYAGFRGVVLIQVY